MISAEYQDSSSSKYARLIEEVAPLWVIIENVPALRSRGLDQVLGSVSALGYDAEWHCIPASALGAPHQRDRVWIVANRHLGQRHRTPSSVCTRGHSADTGGGKVADAAGAGRQAGPCGEAGPAGEAGLLQPARLGGEMAWGSLLIDGIQRSTAWSPEPGVGRTDDGLPAGVDGHLVSGVWERSVPRTVLSGTVGRVDRVKALGNSVVPQIPELIGRAILAAEARRNVNDYPFP